MISESAQIIPEIIDQHAEEAALLWLRRDRAVGEPHYSLADLAALDEQLEAHLDGLRIAGDVGWLAAKAELRWNEPGEVFACAVLAFESGDEDRIETVLEAAGQSYERSRPLVSALGWLSEEHAATYIDRLLASESPDVRRMGIAASAVHRRDPGQVLARALRDPDAPLRSRALRAVGELGRVDLLSALQVALDEEVPSCRFWAAWSLTLLDGDRSAVQILKDVAQSGKRYDERAVQLAPRRMEVPDARAWIEKLSENPRTLRLAVIAAGALGDPGLVGWLIDPMRVPEHARVAGEAFSTITGLDLADWKMEAEWPAGFQAGPTEDPDDEKVALDADENLPWPNPELVARWWQQHKGGFSTGARYFLGKPLRVEPLQEVLRTGRQRQRAAAALELALRQPGQPLFEVRAPGSRQQKLLNCR